LAYFSIRRVGPPGRWTNQPTWQMPGCQTAQSAHEQKEKEPCVEIGQVLRSATLWVIIRAMVKRSDVQRIEQTDTYSSVLNLL